MTEQEWLELKLFCIRFRCPECGPHLVLSSSDEGPNDCGFCRFGRPPVSIESQGFQGAAGDAAAPS